MTPEAGARRLEQFASEMPRTAEKALGEALKLARERAIWWSSGPFTTKELRRLYDPHGPYSTADPHPPADEARINEQTGNLLRGWVVGATRNEGGALSGAVYNTSKEAAFMGKWEGDEWVQGERSKMIARPLPVRVMDEIEPKVRALIAAALGVGD